MPMMVQAQEETTAAAPLITAIGLIEGDLLETLESRGPMSAYRLVHTQDCPASLVLMAIGDLIRTGLIQGTEARLELTSELAARS